MLTKKQQGVLRGMVTGFIATALAIGLAILVPPVALIPQQNCPVTLADALKWDVLLVGCLAVNIGLLARHRFFTAEDIDGGDLTIGTPQAPVLQSTLQNTLEQTVLGCRYISFGRWQCLNFGRPLCRLQRYFFWSVAYFSGTATLRAHRRVR